MCYVYIGKSCTTFKSRFQTDFTTESSVNYRKRIL
jgi:hypothetical protein